MKKKFDIFISYAHADIEVADEVCALLKENYISYFIDRTSIRTGSNWIDTISSSIDSCKVFLMLVSTNALNSKFVMDELLAAYTQDIPIVPYLIEENVLKGKLSSRAAFVLNPIQWMPMTDYPVGDLLLKELLFILKKREVKLRQAAPAEYESIENSDNPPREGGDEPTMIQNPIEFLPKPLHIKVESPSRKPEPWDSKARNIFVRSPKARETSSWDPKTRKLIGFWLKFSVSLVMGLSTFFIARNHFNQIPWDAAFSATICVLSVILALIPFAIAVVWRMAENKETRWWDYLLAFPILIPLGGYCLGKDAVTLLRG